MPVSLEERLATFRRTYKPPPQLPKPESTSNSQHTTGLSVAEPAGAPDQAQFSSAGPLRTVGEVEDTLYNDFVKADKRVVGIYVLMWLILFGTAVLFEFGAVYFVLSILYMLWRFGLRQRKLSEVSAYSVFNPGVVAIQGSQLTGEQMQRTMGIR